MSTISFVTVLMLQPVMREMERRDEPSTSIFTICVRLESGSWFMGVKIYWILMSVKQKYQFDKNIIIDNQLFMKYWNKLGIF